MQVTNWQISTGVCHVASRKLLLFKLLWEKSCRGISLITQELLLVMYISRYIDMLYLFESLPEELVKVAHLVISLAIVLIIRYSSAVAATYDADLDTVPRAAMLLPPFVLALCFNKVVLIIEILHQFSRYLEAIVLIPQFVLLYSRQKYENWVLVFTVLLGAESLGRSLPLMLDWQRQQTENPYGLCAAFAQVLVYVTGLTALGLRRIETNRQQGLNEATSKPAFDEVWEAGKFEFQEGTSGASAGAQDQKAKVIGV